MNRYRHSFLFLILYMAVIAGCRTSQMPVKQIQSAKPINYTIIYMVHGDANYLYHDTTGRALQADLQVLQEAKQVAKNAENGEVFIFHLKPETKILWIFPRKDRRFWYYRNGELVYEKRYSPHSKEMPFVTEAKLYQRLHQSKSEIKTYKTVMLYFGHEIPVQKGIHYHRSRPEARFSTALFVKGLQRFLQPDSNEFDLTVLSTCENGTPKMVHALTPFTDYILASPQNLHLSQIDTKALKMLDKPGVVSMAKLANTLASRTFEQLSSFLETVVTLTVYNTDITQTYLSQLADAYQMYLTQHAYSTSSAENIDCEQLSFFDTDKTSKGVKVWYKAPQFGQKAAHTTFSGWGCKM